ncbi:LCP family protein [Clostridium sp. C2-6-12]|uniref:LCP family protein n=1 Tax=Clostridium sp. C2-6-12 TaxID=2698832 RepID=UPI001369B196|nr:LCP family protein [Clostridium sp. C2-6-12]
MFKKNKPLEFDNNPTKDIFNKKSKITWKKVVLSIFFLFCIVLIGVTFILNSYLNKINKIEIDKNDLSIEENISDREQTELQNSEASTLQNSETDALENNNIQNIALFGIDETEGIAGRSDCIMILTIDNKHKKLKLSSIIRDSYVVIPGKGKKDKINHAYAFGGPQLALKTLNENFKLNINQFISVNFSSLPKIIDSIGGLQLNITTDELKYINNYIENLNNLNGTTSPDITISGLQKVDGTQALAYCRIRYTDGGDFERTHRHRIVLNQLYEKCKALSINQYTSILNQLLPLVDTNLEKSEILSLALNLNSFRSETILQDRFPRDEDGNGKIIDGIYYYVHDEDATIKKIHNFIFESNN